MAGARRWMGHGQLQLSGNHCHRVSTPVCASVCLYVHLSLSGDVSDSKFPSVQPPEENVTALWKHAENISGEDLSRGEPARGGTCPSPVYYSFCSFLSSISAQFLVSLRCEFLLFTFQISRCWRYRIYSFRWKHINNVYNVVYRYVNTLVLLLPGL